MPDSSSTALVPVAAQPSPVPWHGQPVLRACAAVHTAGLVAANRLCTAPGDDRGQSTAEYALVILGAAAVAALLVAWASQTNKISRLLDVILDNVINRFR